MIKIIYGFAIIIGFASTALAIRCHSCSSLLSHDCADPFKGGSRYEADCSTLTNPLKVVGDRFPDMDIHPSGCLKVKLETSDGVEVVTRSCYFGDIKDSKEGCKQSKKLLQGLMKQISCDVCTSDVCNSSTATGAFAAIVMLFTVFVRMMS